MVRQFLKEQRETIQKEVGLGTALVLRRCVQQAEASASYQACVEQERLTRQGAPLSALKGKQASTALSQAGMHTVSGTVCSAAVAAARSCNDSSRSPSHTGHPNIDVGDCPMTGFRCAADSDHQVQADRSLDVCCYVARTGACDPEPPLVSQNPTPRSKRSMVDNT